MFFGADIHDCTDICETLYCMISTKIASLMRLSIQCVQSWRWSYN